MEVESPSQKSLTLPGSNSKDLILTHPTLPELQNIYHATLTTWGDALTFPQYLSESNFLVTIPLARDGGLTIWILTTQNSPDNGRPILASCETFKKRVLVSNKYGEVEEKVVYGIGSVFCEDKHRRRGYAGRMMVELDLWLRGLDGDIVGSILFSDIGASYYEKFGWGAAASNTQLELPPLVSSPEAEGVTLLEDGDLVNLCGDDETLLRRQLGRSEMVVIPDLEHMLWHLGKEDFVSTHLFGKKAVLRGAVSGSVGERVWCIWVRRWYGEKEGSVLYILRLVIENSETSGKDGDLKLKQAEMLRSVMRAAQREASVWNMDKVVLWGPKTLVRGSIDLTGIRYESVERNDALACISWFEDEEKEWVEREYYSWC